MILNAECCFYSPYRGEEEEVVDIDSTYGLMNWRLANFENSHESNEIRKTRSPASKNTKRSNDEIFLFFKTIYIPEQ